MFMEDLSVYDVFISYCPDAAEASLVPHLQGSLDQLGITTFVLPTDLWAEQLPSSVKRAIAYSKLDLVIFSVAYASSKRCLSELSLIGAKRGSLVLPLFYGIPKLVAYDAILQHLNEVPQQEFENWRIILSTVGAISVTSEQSTNLLEISNIVSNRVKSVLVEGIQGLAVELSSCNIEQLDYQVEEIIVPAGDNNLLEKLPDRICLLSLLKTLNLSNCRALKSLPDSIGALFYLETMVLKDCTSLENLPATLSESRHLKHLNISGCASLKIPETAVLTGLGVLPRLLYLQHLEIDLDKVPTRINEFEALSTLSIQGGGSTSIPKNVGQLTNLAALEIKNSDTLQTLPDTVGQLHRLAKLWIIACPNLKSLPNSICTLPNLQSLRISGGGYLRNLPQDFGKLRHSLKLLVLDISHMTVFPDVLIRFKDAELHVCAVNRPMPWMTSSSSRSISFFKATVGYMVDIDYVIQKKLGPNATNVKLHIRAGSAKPTDHDVEGLD